jgi:hypothetical protein
MRPPFLLDAMAVEAYTGTGARGPTYATPVTVRCSVQPDYRLLVDNQGRQFQALAVAIVRPDATFAVESRVTTADGRKYRVIADDPLPDASRTHHRELVLGSIQ